MPEHNLSEELTEELDHNDYSGITNYPTPGDNENREPEYTGIREERAPNYYISPFLELWLKGWVQDFLQQNQDTPFSPDSEDSWQWTVEEARKLFQKLS